MLRYASLYVQHFVAFSPWRRRYRQPGRALRGSSIACNPRMMGNGAGRSGVECFDHWPLSRRNSLATYSFLHISDEAVDYVVLELVPFTTLFSI